MKKSTSYNHDKSESYVEELTISPKNPSSNSATVAEIERQNKVKVLFVFLLSIHNEFAIKFLYI